MQILQQFAQAVPVSYADHPPAAAVESWVLLIAGAVLLLEWLLSRRS